MLTPKFLEFLLELLMLSFSRVIILNGGNGGLILFYSEFVNFLPQELIVTLELFISIRAYIRSTILLAP
jgi:hypothetical protein